MQTTGELTGLAKCCDRLSFHLARLSTGCAGALFFINVGDMLMGVGARYVFHGSPVWTEELARYTLIWMVMIAANPALRYGEHMTIDLALKKFPVRLQAALKWFRRLIFIAITGFMAYIGWAYTVKISHFTTMGLGISKSIPMAAVPVGFGLLLIQYVLMQFIPARSE